MDPERNRKALGILAPIIGHDFGIRLGDDARLINVAVSSDGRVLGAVDDGEVGSYVCTADYLAELLDKFFSEAGVNAEERAEFDRLYARNVVDLWVPQGLIQ